MPTPSELLADVREMQADMAALNPAAALCDFRDAVTLTITPEIRCVQGENPVIEEMVVLGGATTDNVFALNVVAADFPQEPKAGDEIRFPAGTGAWFLIRTVTKTQGDPTLELLIKRPQ